MIVDMVQPASPYRFESRVRFGDTDASGRIFYVSLLRHFEAAESEFLRHLGCSYNNFQTPKVDFPRVRVECDYISPLGYDDLLNIEVTVERIGRSSFTLGFTVMVEGRLAARAKLTIVAMDPRTHKSTPLPDALRAALTR
jgi:YbgC/YbaW family acyl-CoA thioester hydrolase